MIRPLSFCMVLAALLAAGTLHAQVGINDSGAPPAAGSMLDVSSTTLGFLPPRMNTVQRDAILSPPEGLTIYNTDTHCLEVFRGASLGWYRGCPVTATVTTNGVSDITATQAQAYGSVPGDGGSTVVARGFCWSTSPGPTISDFTVTDGLGTGSFATALTGLSAGTTYYVRAFATNSVGTGYGNEISFSTLGYASLTTDAVSSVTPNAAQGGGNVTADGGSPVTSRGICWSTSPSPDLGDSYVTAGAGLGAFTAGLSGLSPGTQYYVRAFAITAAGESFGNEVTFHTQGLLYFTQSGGQNWTVPSGVTSLQLTVVGGGGGGGGDVGGGGGGGQVINVPSYSVTPGQVLTITVAPQTDFPLSYAHFGRDGFSSSVSGGNGGTIAAQGGNGGRGRGNGGGAGANVGWNGGGGSYDYGTGNAGQGGYAGGNAYPGRCAGGGGGSGGMGENAPIDRGGNGGPGVQSIIDGIYYGGGGGGGEYQGNSGGAGTDGGGTGGRQGNNPSGTDGLPNRGGGGGGGGSTGQFPNSGRGGSGVVIVAYTVSP